MNLAGLKDKRIAFAPLLLVAAMFFIPISPTIKTVLLLLGMLVLISTRYYRQLSFYTWFSLWGLSAVALFSYIMIATLWSPAPFKMQWLVVGKYCKLIYLPILAVGFVNPRIRTWSLNSYLAAILLTCIISILRAKGILSLGMYADQGAVFYNHIITGFMVALASYIAGLFVFQYKGWVKFLYFAIWLLTSYQIIFINTGRTGYLIYFVLMILLLIQKLAFRQAVLGSLLFCSLFLLGYNLSPIMQSKVHSLINEVSLFKHNVKETSLGYRYEFHQYAQSLLVKHPLLGIGTGGFKYQFYKDNPIPSWGTGLTDPHSQYWMILAEQGILGFLLLLFFFASLFVTSFQLKETRPILLGLLVVFCIGCATDTILSFSAAGYLLIIMSALCFGELLEIRGQNNPRIC